MSEVEPQERETSGFVERRIQRDWRNEIEVLGVTTRRRRLIGKKHVLVEIGCRSEIACEQARISLAGVVANDASDWRSHWEVVEGSKLPFRLRLVDPRPEGHFSDY